MKQNILAFVILFFFIALALVGIGFAIYVYVTYGNTPITELPAWVLPFFTH